ncbi:MAG: sulfite exporter TauE/SafE family protein [Alphaproteobacteria bacterium]|nr:sulfite exporter TauE/SafE family protein [Alphaproteobacteria bacterium]
MDVLTAALLCLAGFAGGVINALAGGGTLVTFPALLAFGLPPKLANATSQVALWPGRLTSVLAQIKDLRDLGPRTWISFAIGLVGGLVGAQLLIAMSPAVFRALIPWLLLAASLVFGFAKPITRWITARGTKTGSSATPAMQLLGRVFEFACSVYGGFFGAGLGVIMMAGYAIGGIQDVKQTNVLKNLMGVVITTTSAITFIVRGEVDWLAAAVMLVGALIGGFAGGKLARLIPDGAMRVLVTGSGLFLAGWYLFT